MLPELFLSRMEEMLGEEFQEFLSGYQMPSSLSLRVNLLKGTEEELQRKAGFLREPIPWAAGGFYCKEEEKPGKHPFHEAGAYYIQEASAMAPAA